MSRRHSTPTLCRLCNVSDSVISARFQQIYPQAEAESVPLDWWECQRCGGWFVDPVPTPAIIERHWSTVLYNNTAYEADIAHKKEAMQQHILTTLAAYTERGALLDMGSNFGNFLVAARKEGWQPSGFDPYQKAVDVSRRLGFADVRCGWTIESAGFPKAHFAAITAIDAFYYVWHPYTTLQTFHELLRPGGVLLMRITNKRLALAMARRLTPDQSARNRRLTQLLKGQYHTVGIPALSRIMRCIGFRSVEVQLRAMTIPWREMGWSTRLSYLTADVVYAASLSRINLHPGVLIIARKNIA